MKIGLSYVSYKDKLLGEQVAYVLDDMLTAVENNRNTIEKEKIINEAIRKRQEEALKERRSQTQIERKRRNRVVQLVKIYNESKKKLEHELVQKEKVMKQQEKKKLKIAEKYIQEKKIKLEQKKKRDEEEIKNKIKQKELEKQKRAKNREIFEEFNQKQVQKLQEEFQKQNQKQKKDKEAIEEKQEGKQEKYRKIREKIEVKDQKMKQSKKQTQEKIDQLYQSNAIKVVYEDLDDSLRAVYDFLVRSTFTSLTERKHNNQIIFQIWQYFNTIFELSPLIVQPKVVVLTFKMLTRDKAISKEYQIGLNYQEFKLALFYIAIKHKSIFNKLAEKIKEPQVQKIAKKGSNVSIKKDQANEFSDLNHEMDIKKLLKETEVNKDLYDDYGDLSKVNDKTIRALLYYLKIPKNRKEQQRRFKELSQSKISGSVPNINRLKEKLNEQLVMDKPKKSKDSLSKLTKNK